MGGKQTKRKTQLDRYEAMRLRVSRRGGVIMAALVIIYIVMAEFSLVPRSIYYDTVPALLIGAGFGAFAVWLLTEKRLSSTSQGIFIATTHGLGAILLLAVSGFMSPMTVLWLVLIVASDMFFSKNAASFSILSLYLVMVAAVVLEPTISQADILLHLSYATVMAAMGWFLLALGSVQADEHSDLVNTKKRQVSQHNQMMTLINSMSQVVISISQEGYVQLYNAATLDMLNTNQNINGQKLDEIFNLVNDQNEPVDILSILNKSGHNMQREDLSHLGDDGELIHLDIASSIIYGPDNQSTGRILLIRDITKAKTLDEERDEFISIVSHELRTPVAIAEGTVSNLQLLIDKSASVDVVKQSIESAYDQIIYLSRMINDLSTLSRAERGIGGDKEIVNLRSLGESLYGEYLPKAQSHGLALNIELPNQRAYVYTSKLYLEEILQNLLTNAIKYTPSGSVNLKISTLKSKRVEIAVSDTGIGISKNELRKVFDRFYRSEDYRTRETSGTGLGLYIVQKLARKLKVAVDVDTAINKGSTFRFIMPLASKQQIDKYSSPE